ncbi:hypothetical protein Tco_0684523, partial [Tanacetum coccineum]
DAHNHGVFRICIISIHLINALNSNDQDSLNSAAGGNFLDKMPRECLKIIESKSKVRQSRNKAVVAKMSTSSSTQAVSSDVAELKDMVRALIQDRKNQTPASAPVKAVEQSCVTCGGGHSYQNCPAPIATCTMTISKRPPGFLKFSNPHAINQNNFNRGNNSIKTGGINSLNQGHDLSTSVHQPVVNQPVAHQDLLLRIKRCVKIDFDGMSHANDAVLRKQCIQADFVVVDFEPDPRVPLILGRCFLKTSHALIDVYEGKITLRVGKEAITFNLDQTSKYTADYNHMTVNKTTSSIWTCDEVFSRGSMIFIVWSRVAITLLFLSLLFYCFPTLTPFGDSDFLLFEEADSFLALEDDPTSSEVDPTYQDPEGDILILEAILKQ